MATTIEFPQRVALVPGGSRGIGRACCLKLAEAGARVAVNYRSNQPAAEATVEAIRAQGGEALAIQADVAVADDVTRMVDQVEGQLGPVDLLVNNAGIFEVGQHTEETLEIWQRTLDCNLTGTFHVTWAVKDGMIERGYGRIVNIASVAALAARPQCIAYSVSKAGVVALTRSLASAVAEHDVRINAVAPGLIDTEILDAAEAEALAAIVEATPMKRMGDSDEVADGVMYLLSDLSRFTTGQTLVCSGGRVLLP